MKMLTFSPILIFTMGLLSLTACSSSAKKIDTPEAKVSTPASEVKTPDSSMSASTEKKGSSKKKKDAKASTPKSDVAGMVTCKSGEEVRTLEIKDAGEGCELVYTKQNEAKTVASAVHDKAFCESKSEKIRGALQSSGYTCE